MTHRMISFWAEPQLVKRIKSNNKLFITFFVLSSLLMLNPIKLHAAKLSIFIKEKGTGVPVEGATVVFIETEVYSTTSPTGLVSFSNIENSKKVKVIATGFEIQEFDVDQDRSELVFYIEPILIEGEGLEVSADRLVEKTSKYKLSPKELITTAGAAGSPLKAANALPGVSQIEEDSADVYMRGSNNNENLFWVNNAPVGYLYHFGGSMSTIHPEMIESLNVFMGGFPVQYGDALGGVLDVKLRTPRNDRRRYKLDFSTITSTFFFEGPVGKVGGNSIAIGGRRSYIDLIMSPEDVNELLGEDNPREILTVPRFHDFQILYHHKLNNGYLDSYLFQSSDKLALKQEESTKGDPNLAGEFHVETGFLTTGVNWQQRWNAQWNSFASFSYSQEEDLTKGGIDTTLSTEQGQAIFSDISEESLQFSPQLNWSAKKGSQTSIGLLGRYKWVSIDLNAPRAYTLISPDFSLTSQRVHKLNSEPTIGELSPYIQQRHQWSNRLTMQAGLRFTNLGATGGFRTHSLSPRVAVEYKLLPDTLFMASWGKYVQMPDRLQIINSFGNPNLGMTKAEHRILGLEHKINSLYHLKAEVYHKPMEDLVIVVDENTPPNNYKNLGTGEAYGMDLFIKREQRHGKFGWLSFSWSKSTRTNQLTGIKREFSGDQPLTLVGVWGQQLSGSWKHWQISGKARIQSGQPYTAVVARSQVDPNDTNSAWVPTYGKHNAERLPVFHKLDLRIAREIWFNQSKLRLYLELLNITFADNIVAYRYGENYEKISNPTPVDSYPIFPFIGVEMEF